MCRLLVCFPLGKTLIESTRWLYPNFEWSKKRRCFCLAATPLFFHKKWLGWDKKLWADPPESHKDLTQDHSVFRIHIPNIYNMHFTPSQRDITIEKKKGKKCQNKTTKKDQNGQNMQKLHLWPQRALRSRGFFPHICWNTDKNHFHTLCLLPCPYGGTFKGLKLWPHNPPFSLSHA